MARGPYATVPPPLFDRPCLLTRPDAAWSIPTEMLRAELARRAADEEAGQVVRPVCGSGKKGTYETGLHVFALFLILMISTLGMCNCSYGMERHPLEASSVSLLTRRRLYQHAASPSSAGAPARACAPARSSFCASTLAPACSSRRPLSISSRRPFSL